MVCVHGKPMRTYGKRPCLTYWTFCPLSDLVESFFIIPDLVIDYSEIARKWSYGLGLAHLNFMGLNQELYLGGAFIGEKWFAIS